MKQATSGDTSRLTKRFTIGEETISADSLVDACVEYYSRFGSHNCCYGDLKDLVEKFTVDERAVFLKAIEEFAREGDQETISAREVSHSGWTSSWQADNIFCRRLHPKG
jgi:hypothetical protein